MSPILISRDQSALCSAAAKCSLIPWHFWVREHFTVCEGGKVREKVTERVTKWEGWQEFWESNKCALISSQPLFSASICVSHTAWVLVYFLYYESLSNTWASAAWRRLLDWPQMSIWKLCRTSSALRTYFFNLSARSSSAAQRQEMGARKGHNKHACRREINDGTGRKPWLWESWSIIETH